MARDLIWSNDGKPLRDIKKGSRKNCIHYRTGVEIRFRDVCIREDGKEKRLRVPYKAKINWCKLDEAKRTCATLRNNGECKRMVLEWNIKEAEEGW
jgi:hypothetical protein